MSAKGRRRGGGHDDHEEHIDESWLVSYADMMTLLVALFMVLFSISSVNISKFEDLQRSMAAAFNGRVLPGGTGIKEQSNGPDAKSDTVPTPLLQLSGMGGAGGEKGAAARKAAAAKEDVALKELKKAVDAAVRERALSGKIRAQVSRRGLEVRLLTDGLLFDSGSAVVKPAGADILTDLAKVLDEASQYPVVVEGHTDDVPITSAVFPTNWELSAARATGVIRVFAGGGIARKRLTAQGRADLDPVADNTGPGGRAMNRRVEILLPRQIPTVPEERASRSVTDGARGENLADRVVPVPVQIRPDAMEASSP